MYRFIIRLIRLLYYYFREMWLLNKISCEIQILNEKVGKLMIENGKLEQENKKLRKEKAEIQKIGENRRQECKQLREDVDFFRQCYLDLKKLCEEEGFMLSDEEVTKMFNLDEIK